MRPRDGSRTFLIPEVPRFLKGGGGVKSYAKQLHASCTRCQPRLFRKFLEKPWFSLTHLPCVWSTHLQDSWYRLDLTGSGHTLKFGSLDVHRKHVGPQVGGFLIGLVQLSTCLCSKDSTSFVLTRPAFEFHRSTLNPYQSITWTAECRLQNLKFATLTCLGDPTGPFSSSRCRLRVLEGWLPCHCKTSLSDSLWCWLMMLERKYKKKCFCP